MNATRDHTAPLFAKLNTLTLSDINKLQTGIFMFKLTKLLLPHSFASYFTTVNDMHHHNTRSGNNLYLPYTRTAYSMNTLRFYGPRLWNSIGEVLKSKSSVGGFKHSYKQFFISQYVT